jgi:hypothetical protein
VSPSFQDPPAQPNVVPFFDNSFPGLGELVKAPAAFEVDLSDPNRQDTVYVRWVSDYPPFTGADSKLLFEGRFPPPRDVLVQARFNVERGEVDCVGFSPFPPGATHRLALIVSDRPFLNPNDAPNTAYQFNAVELDATVAQMATWIITDCP